MEMQNQFVCLFVWENEWEQRGRMGRKSTLYGYNKELPIGMAYSDRWIPKIGVLNRESIGCSGVAPDLKYSSNLEPSVLGANVLQTSTVNKTRGNPLESFPLKTVVAPFSRTASIFDALALGLTRIPYREKIKKHTCGQHATTYVFVMECDIVQYSSVKGKRV